MTLSRLKIAGHLFYVVVLLAALVATAPPPAADAQGLTAHQVNDQMGVGINLGNALEGPREGDWGLTLQAEYFTTIAEAGFGHVRVPIRFSAYTGGAPAFEIPDGIDPTVPHADNLWDRIDWVIHNAEANGLYVVLDLHLFDELSDNIAGERDRFLAIWEQISERYADASDWVLFELLNEPQGQFNDDRSQLNTLLADAISIIRATNPTRPILVGPAYWNQIGALESLELPNDPNLIVSVHFYDPFDFTHQGATWLDTIPPAPASFEPDLVGFGAGWGDWSWRTTLEGSSESLTATFERQWSGLAFGSADRLDPASLRVVVSGTSELRVRCALANDVNTEVADITTTAVATTFDIDMSTCPDATRSLNFMVVSPTFSPLTFYEIELCEADGECRRLIETGAQAIESAFDTAAAWGQANGRPMNVGEFGAYGAEGVADLADRAEWTELVRVAGQSRGMSMTYWEFGAGFGAYDRNVGAWVQPLVDALGVEPRVVVPACVDDGFEDDDMSADAKSVDAGVAVAAHMCGTDDDWFEIAPGVDEGDTINVAAAFGNDLGGVHVSIVDPQLRVAVQQLVATPQDLVELQHEATQAGTYYVFLVGAVTSVDVSYDLTVWVTPPCNGLAPTINMNLPGVTGVGTTGPDVIVGTPGADSIDGRGGDDTICAGSGDDRIYGRSGNDVVFGEGGMDRILGDEGADEIHGGAGHDRIWGQGGVDVIRGGEGNDLLKGGDDGDELFGDGGNDRLTGDRGADVLSGGPGVDRLWGFDGDDELFGGDGRDTLLGMNGDDLLEGEAGDDVVLGQADDDHVRGGDGNDAVNGGPGDDFVYGERGHDRTWGLLGSDTVDGGDGNDLVNGGGVGPNRLLGGLGHDRMVGGSGLDSVWGGPGNDRMWLGLGDDVAYGGPGADRLFGQGGNDTCDGGSDAVVDITTSCEILVNIP